MSDSHDDPSSDAGIDAGFDDGAGLDDALDAGLAAFFGRSLPGAAEARLEPGEGARELGDYRILAEIGRGGMGVVYLAEQVSLRRRVALKVLPAHLTRSPDAVARFQVEASSAARLRHPGIVQVHAVGEHDGHHFFAMELVDGRPLDDVIADLRKAGLERLDGSDLGRAVSSAAHVPAVCASDAEATGVRHAGAPAAESAWHRPYLETVCRLVAQVADALQHAHDAGVIHRDVKPSNILVRANGTAVLTDFGLAREEGLPGLTRTGVFAGTPHYASPEQAQAGERAVDHRTDVFSLGVTLYELLTLRHPFLGRTSAQVLDSIVNRDPRSPRRVNRRLPADLQTIVLKALEKEPARRYATAGAFAADLRAFLAMEPIAARPASLGTRIAKFTRRHRPATAAAAAAAVAVVAGGAWWLARSAYLTVDVAEGATIYIDGERQPDGTVLDDAAFPPGEYRIRAEKDDRASALVTLVLERGEHRSVSLALLSPALLWEDVRNGEVDLEAFVPHTSAQFQAGLHDILEGHLKALERRLADGEAPDSPAILAHVAPLFGASRKDAEALIDEANALWASIAEQRVAINALLAAPAEGAPLAAWQTAWTAIRALTLPADSSFDRFEPLAAARADLQGNLAGRLLSAAVGLEAQLDRVLAAPDDQAESTFAALDAVVAFLESVDPQKTERLGERIAARKTQRRLHRLAFAADDPELAVRDYQAILEQMRALDPNSPLIDPVHRRYLAKLGGVRDGLKEDACAAFRQRAASQLRGTIRALREAGLPAEDLKPFEDARDWLDTYLRAFGRNGAPLAAARSIHDELCPPDMLAETFRADGRAHLEELDRAIRRADARREATVLTEAVDRAYLDRDLAGAEAALGRLGTLRDLDPKCGDDAERTVASLRAELGEWQELQQGYDEFRRLVSEEDLAAAKVLLEGDLKTGWKRATARIDQTLRTLRTLPASDELLLRRATSNLRLGNYDDALRDAEQLDGSAEGALLRGLCRYGRSRFREAADEFDAAFHAAFERGASGGRALYWRGTCRHILAEQGRDLTREQRDDLRRLALADLEQAVAAGIDTADAHAQLARIHVLRESYRKAIDAATAALARRPHTEDEILRALGGNDHAVNGPVLARFVRDIYNTRAQAHLGLQDYARCIADCREALKLDAKCYEAHLRCGFSHGKLNEFREGIRHLDLAARYAPTDEARDEIARQKQKLERRRDDIDGD